MQHVGVTSASEVHKYPADIGKYIVAFITDALECSPLCFYTTLQTANLLEEAFSLDRKKVLIIQTESGKLMYKA